MISPCMVPVRRYCQTPVRCPPYPWSHKIPHTRIGCQSSRTPPRRGCQHLTVSMFSEVSLSLSLSLYGDGWSQRGSTKPPFSRHSTDTLSAAEFLKKSIQGVLSGKLFVAQKGVTSMSAPFSSSRFAICWWLYAAARCSGMVRCLPFYSSSVEKKRTADQKSGNQVRNR